jgi:uncharacterized protein
MGHARMGPPAKRTNEHKRWTLDAPGHEIGYLKPMRFTQDATSASNAIRGYGAGEIRINDQSIRDSVIVSAAAVLLEPALHSVVDLAAEHVARILQLDPQLVLLGTGRVQIFPAATFGAQFTRVGVGFEVMDTGAACRTFNVLVAEQRRVVAVLLL